MASQQVKILTFHFMQTLLNTPYIAFTIAIYIIFLFVKESQAVLINKYHVQNGQYLSIFGFFKKRPKIPELLAFHSNSEFSKLMLPIIDKVSKDTGLHIEVIQVDDHKNYELFSSAMNFCGEGGLPLYLNVSTGEYILGITTYENLKLLALGKKPERYSRINVNLLEDASYRTTGLIGRLKRFIRERKIILQIKLKGQENIFKRYKETISKKNNSKKVN